MFCSLYTILFISWYGFLVPAAIAQTLYSFKIKKYKIALLPEQLTNWLYSTIFYDRFIRKVRVDKELRQCRTRGLWMLLLGMSLLWMDYSSPGGLDLDKFVVVRGIFEGYEKLGRKNPCGSLLLTICLEDGTLAKFRDSGAPNLKELEKNKGMGVALWAKATPRSMYPECREFPAIAQIQSRGYQRLYNKNQSGLVSVIYTMVGILLTICGCGFMLYIACQSDETTGNS